VSPNVILGFVGLRLSNIFASLHRIHIPGAIQSFGALIAIRENEVGRFIVRVVSENSCSITGLEPEALFELRCFTDLLIKSDKHEFLTRVRGLRNHQQDARTNPDVFSLSLTSLLGAPLACFIAMHWNWTANLIICEFELKKDVFNPRHPPDEGLPSGGPIHIIENEALEAERKLSTTSRSTPLHAVQVARETSRQLGSMELFHVLCEIQNQLTAADSLPSLLDIIVGLVYELTSYHRVMVYQFDETAAGYVVSEIVDPRASTDIYRGLKFPASDIPKQARDLYLINKIRVLYDRDRPTARLVGRTKEDAAIPLDLTHSYLRAMSPVHIKYLENMGVRASMSISLTVGDKLWGLISCHNYGNGMRVALPVRELCRALGDLASTNIEKLIYSTRIKARKPLSNAPPKRSPSAYIAASSGELLNMFGADFGFLAIKGEARTIGKLFAYNEAIMLLQYIREKNFTSIFSTQNLSNDCSDISYGPGFVTIAGMLVIPLSLTSPDFLVFFRKGQTMEVQWAGNPHQKKLRNGRYLEPRASFRRWSEHVVGRSREWTEDQGKPTR
jgi:light-regulated signal transduction histidine kinase (bacteriophytochrome)